MLTKLKDTFSPTARAAGLAAALTFGAAANANAGDIEPVTFTPDRSLNYVQNCVSGNCAKTHGSRWSSENPQGVAVSVRMGVRSVVSDARIQEVLTKGLNMNGVDNIQFFFEQNDTSATGIYFHVRGGTDGPHLVNGNIKYAVEEIARYATTDDPILAAGFE